MGEAAAEAVAEVQRRGSTAGRPSPRTTARGRETTPTTLDPGDEQATQGGAHVELESDVTDETGSGRGAGDAGTAEAAPTPPEVSAETSGPAPVEAAVEVQPAARGRRRRGRVVAPAGPLARVGRGSTGEA